MPIESKLESDENEFEWRLSFSQAEQKLVYSMNHTQISLLRSFKNLFKRRITFRQGGTSTLFLFSDNRSFLGEIF